MASYHCSVKSNSKTSVKALNHEKYVAREGKYRNKEDLEHKEHGNMPSWAKEHPEEFWKAADTYERANGRTYTEIEIALPNELNPEQRLELVREFVTKEIGENHPYTFAIHCPKAALKHDTDQPHAHIMFSERKMDGIERDKELFFKRANSKHPELGGTKKEREWNSKDKVERIRESWALLQNRTLEKYGYEIRVDHRSLEAQKKAARERGDFKKAEELDRPAQEHLGPKIIQTTAVTARQHMQLAQIPEDREQKREDYYATVETKSKARNVYYLKEYQRTNRAIEKEKQHEAKNPALLYKVRLKEINLTLNHLLSERKELNQKVISPERAELIAQSIYTKGATKNLAAEDRLLTNERERFDAEHQKHLVENKPNILDHTARTKYEVEANRLAAWGKDLTVREASHQMAMEQLKATLQTPRAIAKIEEIKKGVLEKNRPLREELAGLDKHIEALRDEKKEITLEKTRLEIGKEKDIAIGQAYKVPGQAMTKLERAVHKLENEERVQQGGLKARIRLDDEYKKTRERDMER